MHFFFTNKKYTKHRGRQREERGRREKNREKKTIRRQTNAVTKRKLKKIQIKEALTNNAIDVRYMCAM